MQVSIQAYNEPKVNALLALDESEILNWEDDFSTAHNIGDKTYGDSFIVPSRATTLVHQTAQDISLEELIETIKKL